MERIKYLDLAKFIAIFLVVWGHVFWENTDHTDICVKYIYSFHMPLFMMISGFFSLNSYTKTTTNFISTKVVQLLFPAISWSVIGVVYRIVLGETEFLRDEFIGNSWFLKTLFVCYVLAYFSKKLKAPDLVIAVASYTVVLLLPCSSSMQINWLYFFFWIGYFVRKYIDVIHKYNNIILIVSLICSVVCFVIKLTYVNTFLSVIAINIHSIITYPMLVINQFVLALSTSLAVIGFCYCIDRYINKTMVYNYLTTIGKNTLGIYVSQTVIIEYILPSILKIHLTGCLYLIVVTIYSIVGVLFCHYLCRYISRNKFLNLFLLGKRS